jgi:stage V sporulation protein D (sporulation-specific penicillin-binding protein)
MAKRRPKKPMLKFPKRMQKKMIVMFTVVAALMIGLIGRLMYIEYTSGEKYEKIVLAQQGYDSQHSSLSERRHCRRKRNCAGNQYRSL